KLLTTSNPETHEDVQLFKKLGINSQKTRSYSDEAYEAALHEEIEQNDPAVKDNELFIDATKHSMLKAEQA
ncbi:MAG: biotin synthase, partial [Glaciecola sp.]